MATNVGNILNAAQSAQLQALRKTASQLDDTSLRLATGYAVNGAIDNPANFFIARSLRNRADDLTRLLDGIGQSIRVIQEADHGIEALQKILDQAESYLQDVIDKFHAGEIESGPSVPTNETYVTFNAVSDFVRYVTGQDTNGSSGIHLNSSTSVTIDGNYWRMIPLNYTITPDTVLEFDYSSTLTPEISSIGFENDTNFGNDSNRFFIYGSQLTGITYAAPIGTYTYTGAGAVQHYEIPVGTYFTGNFANLTFIHDDDLNPVGNATFSDITLREGPKQTLGVDPKYEEGYQAILNQIDLLVKDAQYRGINLLAGDDLTTYFNPSNTSKLVTEGINATYQGLGLNAHNFNTVDLVEAKLAQVKAARETVRRYAATVATNLSIIETRQILTNAQINISKEGADELTVADQNEEGAKLLALQTRQQMEITMLALRPVTVLSVLS